MVSRSLDHLLERCAEFAGAPGGSSGLAEADLQIVFGLPPLCGAESLAVRRSEVTDLTPVPGRCQLPFPLRGDASRLIRLLMRIRLLRRLAVSGRGLVFPLLCRRRLLRGGLLAFPLVKKPRINGFGRQSCVAPLPIEQTIPWQDVVVLDQKPVNQEITGSVPQVGITPATSQVMFVDDVEDFVSR